MTSLKIDPPPFRHAKTLILVIPLWCTDPVIFLNALVHSFQLPKSPFLTCVILVKLIGVNKGRRVTFEIL